MLTPPPPPSIVRLYVSVVTVVAKFVREYSLGIAHSIRYDQLPHVDHVLGLCTHVFLAHHELGELQLEQDLFATLIFLCRSPDPMVRWTRPCPPGPRRPPAGHPPTMLPGLQQGHGKQLPHPKASGLEARCPLTPGPPVPGRQPAAAPQLGPWA